MVSVSIAIRSATENTKDQDHESCTASSQDLENDRIESFILPRSTDFPEPHFAYNPEKHFPYKTQIKQPKTQRSKT